MKDFVFCNYAGQMSQVFNGTYPSLVYYIIFKNLLFMNLSRNVSKISQTIVYDWAN